MKIPEAILNRGHVVSMTYCRATVTEEIWVGYPKGSAYKDWSIPVGTKGWVHDGMFVSDEGHDPVAGASSQVGLTLDEFVRVPYQLCEWVYDDPEDE